MIALGYLREAKKGVSLGAHGLFLTRYIATDKLSDLLSGPAHGDGQVLHGALWPYYPPEGCIG